METLGQRNELKIRILCEIYDITPEQLRSKTKSRKMADIRCIFCNRLLKDGHLVPDIGKLINRDRTSVIAALKKFDILMSNDRKFISLNDKIDEKLNS